MFDSPVVVAILEAVKANSPKKNCTISGVISATEGDVNGVTLNIELSSTEEELVVKTFTTVDGMVEGAREQARAGGYPTKFEEVDGSGGNSGRQER